MVQLPHLQKVHGALSVQQRKQFPLPSENSPQEQGRIAHRSLHARLPAQLRQDQECHPPLHASGAYSAALYPRLPGDEEGAARGAESAVAGCGVGLPPQSTQAAPREAQAARDCDDGRPEPAGPALQGDHDQAGLQVGAHGRQGRGHRGQAAGQEGAGQRQRGGRDPQVPAAWGREKSPDGAHGLLAAEGLLQEAERRPSDEQGGQARAVLQRGRRLRHAHGPQHRPHLLQHQRRVGRRECPGPARARCAGSAG
mmetsp:Transcript_19927/g.27364  ORF Transcript_19927/g.27364 Transcript_19927/m.27364 type:complete len:254 (-) Transcript_19927:1080-1841(-)